MTYKEGITEAGKTDPVGYKSKKTLYKEALSLLFFLSANDAVFSLVIFLDQNCLNVSSV